MEGTLIIRRSFNAYANAKTLYRQEF